MSLISLNVPLKVGLRIVRSLERIADYCDRVSPPVTDMKEPEPGLTVVTNENVLEEQTRANLRALGYKPDDIDAIITEAKTDAAETNHLSAR
jgi:hypothetical protein